jgi:DNA replication protein DnaC
MGKSRPAARATMDRHAELTAMLHTLKLPSMADTFADLALQAAKANLTHEAFLYELVQAERQGRAEHRIVRLRRASGLPLEKTFATLDLTTFPLAIQLQVERLRSGSFVAEAINIVAAGKPGVGKTHLLAAIGHELVLQGHPVLWTATATLVQRLLAAKRDLRLPHMLAQLDRFACLILDDIGYVQHDRDEMEVLFTLLAERYERRSVAITTNLMFSEWNRIFKDPMTTMAAIDRVVHHSVILDLMGMESFRAKEATEHRQSVVAPPDEERASSAPIDPVP